MPLSMSPSRSTAGEQIEATVMARPRDNVLGWVMELPAEAIEVSRIAHSTACSSKADHWRVSIPADRRR